MAYSEELAGRVRTALRGVADVAERKMFGGLCFTLRGNMLVGIVGDELMARIGEEACEAALARPGARPMDFTGRPMKGYVFVDSGEIARTRELSAWIDLAIRHVGSLPAKAAGRAAKASTQESSRPKPAGKRAK